MTKSDNAYDRAAHGVSITDEMVERLAEQAECGYDVDEILRQRGRPSIGNDPAQVGSVRLDPELKEALTRRAKRDGKTASSIIREALREYLRRA